MSTTENSTESDRKQFMTWKQLTPKKPSTSASHNSQNNESTVKQKKSAVPRMPADLLQVSYFIKVTVLPLIDCPLLLDTPF